MKKVKTKESISVAINIELYDYLKENISNRSKYVEWLVYQDLKEKGLVRKDLYIL